MLRAPWVWAERGAGALSSAETGVEFDEGAHLEVAKNNYLPDTRTLFRSGAAFAQDGATTRAAKKVIRVGAATGQQTGPWRYGLRDLGDFGE